VDTQGLHIQYTIIIHTVDSLRYCGILLAECAGAGTAHSGPAVGAKLRLPRNNN